MPSDTLFFFFNDTATTEIYTLSLHDALPILARAPRDDEEPQRDEREENRVEAVDRKSTRLNSSHSQISYAVFCLKKKKKHYKDQHSNTNNKYDIRSHHYENVTQNNTPRTILS